MTRDSSNRMPVLEQYFYAFMENLDVRMYIECIRDINKMSLMKYLKRMSFLLILNYFRKNVHLLFITDKCNHRVKVLQSMN